MIIKYRDTILTNITLLDRNIYSHYNLWIYKEKDANKRMSVEPDFCFPHNHSEYQIDYKPYLIFTGYELKSEVYIVILEYLSWLNSNNKTLFLLRIFINLLYILTFSFFYLGLFDKEYQNNHREIV